MGIFDKVFGNLRAISHLKNGWPKTMATFHSLHSIRYIPFGERTRILENACKAARKQGQRLEVQKRLREAEDVYHLTGSQLVSFPSVFQNRKQICLIWLSTTSSTKH